MLALGFIAIAPDVKLLLAVTTRAWGTFVIVVSKLFFFIFFIPLKAFNRAFNSVFCNLKSAFQIHKTVPVIPF